MAAMRAAPCASSVRIGICQPCHERAGMPMSLSTNASRPAVTSSPEATTESYSRGVESGAASWHQATSSLVLPAMAETTTATSWPASTSRFTWARRCGCVRRRRPRCRRTSSPDAASILETLRERAGSRRASGRRIKAHAGGVNALWPLLQRVSERFVMRPGRRERHLRGSRPFRSDGRRLVGPDGPMAPLPSPDPGPDRLGARLDRPPFRAEAPRARRSPASSMSTSAAAGGLFAEPLARLGADVVGVDPAEAAIEAARRHAEETGARLAYRMGAVEEIGADASVGSTS